MMPIPDTDHQSLDVLVTGAGGRQGGAVARALLAHGHRVRAMSRSTRPAIEELVGLGATPVLADLEDPASLDAALRDADALFAVQTFTGPDGVQGEERQGRNLAAAARRAMVGHVVYSSVGAADAAGSVPHFASKAHLEDVFRATGRPLTILRPAFFMDNFNDFAVTVAGDGSVDVALALPADRPLQMVATDDIGMAAAAALNDPQRFVGRTVELSGDELTGNQIAAAIGEHLGRRASYTALPLEAVAAHSAEMGAMFGFLDEHGYRADFAELSRLLLPLRTFAQWLRETDFRPTGAEQ